MRDDGGEGIDDDDDDDDDDGGGGIEVEGIQNINIKHTTSIFSVTRLMLLRTRI